MEIVSFQVSNQSAFCLHTLVGFFQFVCKQQFFNSMSAFCLLALDHGGLTLELCYNSGHISNPFSPPLLSPTLGLPYPLNTMWPRIDIQYVLKPQCLFCDAHQFHKYHIKFPLTTVIFGNEYQSL